MPTLTDNKKTDDKYNPSSKQPEVQNGEEGTLKMPDNLEKELQNIEDYANRDGHKVNLTKPGDAAVSEAASAAGGAIGGTAGAMAGRVIARLKTKKGGAGTIAAAMLIGIVAVLLGFMGSSSLIIHVKEIMTEKFSAYSAVIDKRQTMILKKRMGTITTTTCAIKVKCKFKGMSKSQMKRYTKNNWEVETGKTRFGRTEILSITSPEPDRVKVTASNLNSEIKKNPGLRKDLMRVYNPRYMATISPAFSWFAKKLGIDKTQKIKGKNTAELDESMKNSIAGVDEDGNKIGRRTVEERDGKLYDSDGKEISSAEADQIKATNAEFDSGVKRVAETGKKATIGLGKSAAITAATGGAGSVDYICSGYYLVQAVGFGAKAVGAIQLARYWWNYPNTADYYKLGSDDPKPAEYIGTKMTTKDQYGESFTDSFGYQFAAYGLSGFPSPPSGVDGDTYRSSIMQFAVGGGLGGALLNFTKLANQYTGNSPQTACKIIKNPFSQVGLLVGGAALTLFSGGVNLGPGLAASLGLSLVLAGVVAVSLPIITNIVAGKLITADAVGGEAGNAATSGAGVVDAQLSQAYALQPMTMENVAQFDQEVLAYNQSVREANNTDTNPLDPLEPGTPANSILATLAATMPRSVGDISKLPAGIMSSVSNGLLKGTSTYAADANKQYTMCQDKDYLKSGYAADPFCNIRYGMTTAEMNRDPEVVFDYMYDNGHVDEDGLPKSGEFNDYISDCIQRTRPLGDTGEEGQADDGAKCNSQELKYQNFRIYYLDTMILDSLDETDTFEIGPISGGTSSGESDSGLTAVNGTDQELAQKILDSGKVNGDSRYMQQIRDYAAGNTSCHINSTILQILATMSESHSFSVSSLNRLCTGVLTASGRSSYHYANSGGHAVDFNYVDGVHATGGATRADQDFIRDILKLMPSGSGIGQVNCRGSANQLSLPPGVSEFNDACNHIHIQVPKDL